VLDSIEDVNFDVDGDVNDEGRTITYATLTLTGDFTNACERYLQNDDEASPDYCQLRLDIPRSIAEELVKQIGAYLTFP